MSVPVSSGRRFLGIAAIVLVLIFGVACFLSSPRGGDAPARAEHGLASTEVPPIRADKDSSAAALLPPDFKFAVPGEFTVATTPEALPLADYAADDRRLIGVEPDLSQLVADALGLKLNLVPVAWADWPLGLTSGKYDAVISNVTVTEERKKKFDFSSYRQDLLGIYARAGSPIAAIAKPSDVAGLKVVVGASTNQDQVLRRWDAQNIAAGLKPVEFQYYDDVAVGRLAVISGRADVSFEPNATGAYAARDGKVHRVGLFPGGWPNPAPIAVVTRRDSGLAAAITQALNAQIANGNYAKVLARWNLTEEAVPGSETNPPGLAGL